MKRLILFFALSGALASCDSGGGDPPPPEPPVNKAPTASVSAFPANAEIGTEITFDGSDSSDPEGDDLTYVWSFEASGPIATRTYDEAGAYTETLTVNDPDGATDSRDVTITVTEAEPDNRAPEASLSLSSTELEVGNELTADGTESSDPDEDELSYTIDFGDGNEANSAEATHVFETAGDYTVKLTVSDGELEATAEAEVSVTEATTNLTVEAIGDDGESLSSPVELLAGSEVIAEGNAPLAVNVPESITELTARVADHDQDMEAYLEAETDFSVSDGSITLTQERVPHCANGFDNDGDGLIGVWEDLDGNGIPTQGDAPTDPGCVSASDDNEAHRVFTRTSAGNGATRAVTISSDPDSWILRRASSLPLPEHIRHAVGNIFFSRDVKISADQDSESFAVRFESGSAVNFSDIVEDDPSVDGWYEPVVEGIEPSFFAQNPDSKIGYAHEAFVNNNPGDGNDDIGLSEIGRVKSLVISWVYEPDKVGANSPASIAAQSVTRSHDGSEGSVRSQGYTDSDLRQ